MIPFICSSRTGKLWCWKSEQWLPVGKGLPAGKHKGFFCGEGNVSLHWDVVCMDVRVCQNSWNCTLKICHVCVCKIYLKKKKKSHSGVSNKDRSAESKAEDEPASSFITVHSGSAQSRGQSAAGPHRGVQDRTGGLDFQRAIVPFPFPGNEENYTRPSMWNLLLFRFPANTWLSYSSWRQWTSVESIQSNSIRTQQKAAPLRPGRFTPKCDKCGHQGD